LNHTSSPFCTGYVGDGVSQTVCLGWPLTVFLLISASQVARIISMSHWHPAIFLYEHSQGHIQLILIHTQTPKWKRHRKFRRNTVEGIAMTL
jgi:hypothetical protein